MREFRRRTFFVFLGLLATGLITAGPAWATDYPTKPVRIIVPYAAGGTTDVIFRAVAGVIQQYWGQPLIVVNRPGAGGVVGTSFAAKQPADGYTLVSALQGPLILTPLQVKVDYALEAFEPVCQLSAGPPLLVGAKARGWKTVNDLVAHARANPGQVRLGTTGFGNLPHLLTLYLQKLGGFEATVVQFAGNAPARKELIAGNIDAFFSNLDDYSYVEQGLITALGVASAERAAQAPDVPTLRELGYPQFDFDIWFGVAVPRGVPAEIKQRIEDTMRQVYEDKSWQAMMRNMRQPAAWLGSRELGDKLQRLNRLWQPFVRDELGITPK